MSLFHRFGIALVILGMMQSLAPTYFRPVRSSLRHLGRFRVALIALGVADLAAGLPWTSPPLAPGSTADQEPDQESHDTEDLAETFAWSEAMTDRRSVQRSATTALFGSFSFAQPGRGAERTRSALQYSQTLSCLAAASSSVTARLCRFTC